MAKKSLIVEWGFFGEKVLEIKMKVRYTWIKK